MKKFQNLINNRLERKNNLVSTDAGRVFPLSKIAEGSAAAAQAPTKFEEGLLKMHPKLFKHYEKVNKKTQSIDTRKVSGLGAYRATSINSNGEQRLSSQDGSIEDVDSPDLTGEKVSAFEQDRFKS